MGTLGNFQTVGGTRVAINRVYRGEINLAAKI